MTIRMARMAPWEVAEKMHEPLKVET